MAAYRKSLVQVRFRLRKDLLSKLEREAKKADRALNDEVVFRIEDSYARGFWQQERENWLIAIRAALEKHPAASETALLKLQELDDKAEREAIEGLDQDLKRK